MIDKLVNHVFLCLVMIDQSMNQSFILCLMIILGDSRPHSPPPQKRKKKGILY